MRVAVVLAAAAALSSQHVAATAHKKKDPLIYLPFDETQGKNVFADATAKASHPGDCRLSGASCPKAGQGGHKGASVLFSASCPREYGAHVDDCDYAGKQKIEANLAPGQKTDCYFSRQKLAEKRGKYVRQEHLGTKRVILIYDIPLAEIVFDYYDTLKSATKGYATLSHDMLGFFASDLVRLNILVNGTPVDALSVICHKTVADKRGRDLCQRLRKEIPRHMFDVPIQAAIGGRVVARETVKALRKDVTAKCYGGDASRKRKLLDKQKAGKKKMRQFGRVDIPQSAFIEALKMGDA